MAERRAAGNSPAWEDLRALGGRGRVAALVALAAALQSVLALPVLVRGSNTHVHYQELVAFADPDVAPESGPVRQMVRIVVFAVVLGWLTHHSAGRPWSGSRILFVATASVWGCVAGVVSAIVWSLGEWFGDVSRTLAVIAVGEALQTCSAAAFQGLVVGLVASALTVVVTARRPAAAVIPSISLAASPQWWVTPVVGAMWAFVFGTAKYTAWVKLFTWHSPTSEQFEDAGSPTPSSVLFGLLAWPPEGRHGWTYVAMGATFLAAGMASERRLLSKAGTDTMLVFFSRCCALGIYTALCLFRVAAEGVVLRHGAAPNMTIVQTANLAVHLMPETLRDSADQILLRGPILLAVPILGIALIAHAIDRLHHIRPCAGGGVYPGALGGRRER
ncbi:hypothetical protein ACFOY4_24225 [Actinomadura syzygii]|uniref:Uncharacterized protein n=1 Tax=Actinomadura syzygii TaxID=1427538 RepID=A0A5D0UK51_9ACTN|nr:hypothetical protein [Actinomadura syzygii]TYC18464.1 hypothetical protein FXF65_01500 [Actinomadura syzygii]